MRKPSRHLEALARRVLRSVESRNRYARRYGTELASAVLVAIGTGPAATKTPSYLDALLAFAKACAEAPEAAAALVRFAAA